MGLGLVIGVSGCENGDRIGYGYEEGWHCVGKTGYGYEEA